MTTFKPRYWNGTGWVREELVTLPAGLTVSDLPQFAEANGIPQDAEFQVVTEYGDSETALRWYVPDQQEEGSPNG